MARQRIDELVAAIPAEKRTAVYAGTKATHEKRTLLLADHFADPDRLRRWAGEIKQHVLENLDTYLPQVEARLTTTKERAKIAAAESSSGLPGWSDLVMAALTPA